MIEPPEPVTAIAAAPHCVGCGRPMVTPFCTACGLDRDGVDPSPVISGDVAALLRKFNLGAGLAPGFWAFGNGAPVLGTIYWLTLLWMPPVAIGIMAYLFFNGNRVALQRKRFASIVQFRTNQRGWRNWSIFLFVFIVGGFVLVIAGWEFIYMYTMMHDSG